MQKIPYIRASEIAEYYFCPVAWFLYRQGYKPEEKIFENGYRKHVKLGETIDKVDRQIKAAVILEVIGIFLILTAGILILGEILL